MSRRRTRLALAAATGLLAAGLASAPTSAAPPVSVGFAVSESLPVASDGMIMASDVPGCATGLVETTMSGSTLRGSDTVFFGEKVFKCGATATTPATATFRIEFSVTTNLLTCETTAEGRWRVIGGTGSFAGAKGNGELIGEYDGNACTNGGIVDNYTGKIKL